MSTGQGKQVMVQGRIVWVQGDLFKGRGKTDFNTKQPIIDPKTGTQKMEYGFGLAVPKSVLNQTGPGQPGEVWNAMHEEAFALFPSRQLPPAFAMKWKDGDGIDDLGVSFAQREGYAGHIVLACTTSLPIKWFKNENGQNFLINEGIRCGDYVNVQLSIKAHPAVGTAKGGLYLNPNAVQFLGYGKEIINTPSGDQIFGTAAPAMPQGASATPIAPAGFITPQGVPNMAPGMGVVPMPGQAPAPHYGVLPPQYAPQGAPQHVPNFAPPVGQPQTGMVPPYPQQSAGGFAPPAYPSSSGMPPLPGIPQPR